MAKPLPLPAPNPSQDRHIRTTEFPAYRFVPGLHPHPFRHPKGHMYTDGSPPPSIAWVPAKDASVDPQFLFAADLFDHHYYWEAHEAWEAMWHLAPKNSAIRDLLQSLIQCAAAALQHHMKRETAARSLLSRATARQEAWASVHGDTIYGVQIFTILQDTAALLGGGEWPTVSLVNT